MKHPLLTVSLLSAAAVLSAAPSLKNTPNSSGLVYERIGAGYVQNDVFAGFTLSGAAFVNDSILVGGSYTNLDGRKGYKSTSGELSRFNLGYVVNVGPGDIIFGASYGQGHMYNNAEVYVADEMTFGVSYRQAIVEDFEFLLGVNRVSSKSLDAITLQYQDVDGTAFNLSLRYNFTRQLDLTAGYALQKQSLGGNTFNVSLGYNF
jgi:hypothetical protein